MCSPNERGINTDGVGRQTERERERSRGESNESFLGLVDTLKSRVQSSYAYASHLSDKGDTINTRKSVLGEGRGGGGVVKEKTTNCFTTCFVVCNKWLSLSYTKFNVCFFMLPCCFLLSMLPETDNKVSLVSHNINNWVCQEQPRHHDCVCMWLKLWRQVCSGQPDSCMGYIMYIVFFEWKYTVPSEFFHRLAASAFLQTQRFYPSQNIVCLIYSWFEKRYVDAVNVQRYIAWLVITV